MAKLKNLEVEGTTSLNNIEISDKTNILEMIYPIGAVYISTVFANPQDLFGFGEWEFLPDRFLLGAGDTFLIGTTGGEINHTLTLNEIPNHAHSFSVNIQHGDGETTSGESLTSGLQVSGRRRYYDVTDYRGGSEAHNNMPPYLVVYMWKRIS